MSETRIPIVVGTAVEVPGSISRGLVPLITLPTQTDLSIPVVIASGARDGPTFLLTANIHGDEVVGVIVVHRFLEELDLAKLKGRVVAFPTLNPTGQLVGTRFPIFEAKDPNRCWPDYRPKTPGALARDKEGLGGYDADDPYVKYQKAIDDEIGPQERAFKPLASIFASLKPKMHLDLHTFSVLSIPFAFMDRILYSEASGPTVKEDAEKLFRTTKYYLHTRCFKGRLFIGLSWVVEQPARQYVKSKLHRSTSGYTLNCLRIPSCTIELGPMIAVPSSCKEAGLIAARNALRWAEMLDSSFEKVTSVPVVVVDQPHRYILYPQVPTTGILEHHLGPGEKFKKGQHICSIRTLDGRLLSKIEAEMDGFLIAWFNGIAKYEGNAVGFVGVPDTPTRTVVPWEDIDKADAAFVSVL